MRPMIQVQPTPELRRAFAVWATEQRPKVRTVSTTAFAVPAELFAAAPEEVLIGALVDGHRYVSPVEDEANGQEAGSELPVPDDSDPGDQADDKPEGVFPCPGCDREFTTARGRDAHRRQAHPEG